MKTANICLSTIQSIRSFVDTVIRFDCEIDLSSGRYTVDAKSIMGIFSLDLMNPIKLTVHGDDAEADKVLEAVASFITE